jgi:hypothetical protein
MYSRAVSSPSGGSCGNDSLPKRSSRIRDVSPCSGGSNDSLAQLAADTAPKFKIFRSIHTCSTWTAELVTNGK